MAGGRRATPLAPRAFPRILLKLSGELLGGADGQGLEATAAAAVGLRITLS